MIKEPQNAVNLFDLDPDTPLEGHMTGITYVLQDIDRIKDIVNDLLQQRWFVYT